MVIVGILIVFIVMALVFADKIAKWANNKLSKTEERKRADEERKRKRAERFEHTQKEIQKLFTSKRPSSVSEMVDTMIEEAKESQKEAESIDNRVKEEEEYKSVHNIKKGLRGPVLGDIYYDPYENNLVSRRWDGEHSIWEDEEERWHSPYERDLGNRYRGMKF